MAPSSGRGDNRLRLHHGPLVTQGCLRGSPIACNNAVM